VLVGIRAAIDVQEFQACTRTVECRSILLEQVLLLPDRLVQRRQLGHGELAHLLGFARLTGGGLQLSARSPFSAQLNLGS
jgi:hypothetical protein